MNYLISLLKRNAGLKFLALFMSVVACTSVHVLTAPTSDDTISHRVYTLPIVYMPPGGGLLYDADEKEVVVTVRGSLAVLNKITPTLLSAEVDLSSRNQPGSAVESIQVRTPNGVSVTSVSPSYTWVRVSNRQIKAVPVRVSLQGQVQSGYSVASPAVYPPNVQISGAEANVERVVELRAPVVISGASSTLSVVARTLIPIDSQGETVEEIDVKLPSVSVTVPVYALVRASVKLDNLKIVTPPHTTYILSVEPKTVLLDARGKTDNSTKAVRVQPQTITVGKEAQDITVPLLIPPGLDLAQGVDKNVVVTITPKYKATGNTRRTAQKKGVK